MVKKIKKKVKKKVLKKSASKILVAKKTAIVKKKAVVVKKKKVPVKKKAAKKSLPTQKPLLERIALAVTTKHGPESIMRFMDGVYKVPTAFSTGIPELNIAIGADGYPAGRIIEIYGPEASGKTTLALHAIAACQKAGGTAQFIDAEHALDVEYAQKLDVVLDKLLISQPDSGEMALNIAESAMGEVLKIPKENRKPNIIVVDSVAALTPQSEIDGEIDTNKNTAEQARMMSKALRKLAGLVGKSGTVLMFINQTRDKINFGFGAKKGTTGGNALKFYASIRIAVQHVGQEKVGDEVIGNNTEVTIVKNKIAPPFKKFKSLIRFGIGFDLQHGRYKNLLKNKDVIHVGAWVTLPDERKMQGYNGFLKFIEDEDNDQYITNILDGVPMSHIGQPDVDDGEEDDSDAETVADDLGHVPYATGVRDPIEDDVHFRKDDDLPSDDEADDDDDNE